VNKIKGVFSNENGFGFFLTGDGFIRKRIYSAPLVHFYLNDGISRSHSFCLQFPILSIFPKSRSNGFFEPLFTFRIGTFV